MTWKNKFCKFLCFTITCLYVRAVFYEDFDVLRQCWSLKKIVYVCLFENQRDTDRDFSFTG